MPGPLLAVTSAGFVLSELSIRLHSRRHTTGAHMDRGSLLVVVAGVVAGVVVAALLAEVPAARLGGWAPYAVGLVLMGAGIGLRQWAVWTLGRSFTVVVRVVEGQPVVDRGPYRWVRHPSYTGLLLTLAGLGAALGSWLSVLALVVLPTAGVLVRVRVEERALLAALGEPYRRYAEGRPRLIPGVW